MPVCVLVDGMGPSDRSSFAVGDTQPSDLLKGTASVAFGEYIAKSADGHLRIAEDV
jgi:hypothetical protein